MKGPILLAVLLFSFSVSATQVSCDVKINDRVITGGIKTIPQTLGEPEGAGHLLIASKGNIKIYVMEYPIEIVANYISDDVVIEAKRSNILGTMVFHGDTAILKTTMGGNKIFAKCNEIENID